MTKVRKCTCGGVIDEARESCLTCGHRHYVLKAEPGAYKVEGHAPALVIDGKDAQTGDLRIRVNSPGGSSDARMTPANDISLQVDGAEAGRKSQPWAIDTLRTAMTDRGIAISAARDEARDDHGEDALFDFMGKQYVVQVATTPSVDDFWRDANHSSAVTKVQLNSGVDWLRATITKKAATIPTEQRGNTILAIDARHAGILAQTQVAESYCSRFSSPASEYGFASTWIVGPLPKYCTRLGDGTP